MRNFLYKYLIVIYIIMNISCSQSSENIEKPINQNEPVFQTIGDQTAIEEQELNFNLLASDPLNSQLAYSIDNPPAGATINTTTGEFSWTPSLNQSGSYSLVFKAIGASGIGAITVKILITNKDNNSSPPLDNLLSINKKNFTEGEVTDKLIKLSINTTKKISYIDAINFNKAFTIIDNMDGKLIDTNLLNTSSRINFTDVTTENIFYTELKGAVKEAGNYNLQFNIYYDDLSMDSIVKSIVVNPSPKGTFKYNLINTLKEDNSTSVTRAQIYEQVSMLKYTFQPGLIPILNNYTEKEILCNGSNFSDFLNMFGDTNSHKHCLLSHISSSAETVFYFNKAETSSGTVGGLAMGIRRGVVISKQSFDHTLAHELGHNFGLAHTHDTQAGHNLHHSQNNNGVYDNGSFKRLVYSPNEVLFLPEYGDGIADTGIDPFGSRFISSLNGGGGVYSAFNGIYENKPHFIFDSVQNIASYFTASSYSCYQEYVSVTSYTFNCAGFPKGYFDDNILNNVMSYWYKVQGQEHFTAGQLNKMISVIDNYPEIK